MEWYQSLAKPGWTPEPATIGRIWSVLYPVIFVSIAFVGVQVLRRKLPWQAVIPFVLNLAANLAFTPIQFGLRNLPLACVDILVVWGSILWMMAVVRRPHPWLALAQIPYLAWVTTATVLQFSITWMNR
jgi:tryptophan-rich sensory protein